MNLLPKSVMPYAKAWVSLLGVIIAAVVTAVPDVPRWLTVAGAVIASVGAYLVPNRPAQNPPASDGTPSATSLPDTSKEA